MVGVGVRLMTRSMLKASSSRAFFLERRSVTTARKTEHQLKHQDINISTPTSTTNVETGLLLLPSRDKQARNTERLQQRAKKSSL